MLISIIVPVFNNAPLIKPFAKALGECVSQWPFRSEVIFIDDASTDSTPPPFPLPLKGGEGKATASSGKLGEGVSFLILRLDRNSGQGGAIVEGLKNASGDFAVTFPVDMEKNLSDIPRIVSEFMEQNSPAMRVVRKGRKYPSAFRKTASLAFNAVLKLFGLSIADIGSSLYIARKTYYQKLIRPEYARFHKTLPVLIWKLSGAIPNFPLTDRSALQNASSHSFRKLFLFAWQTLLACLTPLPKSSERPRNPLNQV